MRAGGEVSECGGAVVSEDGDLEIGSRVRELFLRYFFFFSFLWFHQFSSELGIKSRELNTTMRLYAVGVVDVSELLCIHYL